MLASSRLAHAAAGGLCAHTKAVVAVTGLGRRTLHQGQRHVLAANARAYSNQYGAPNPGGVSGAPPAAGPDPAAGAAPPVFVSFDIYKSRGALSIKPILPTWETLPNGAFKLAREGVFFVEMAPSSGANDRTYSWDKKVSLALSCFEVCSILDNPNKEYNFFHDPNKGRAGEGTVQKTLKWKPSDNGEVYYVNASVRDKTNNTDLSASTSLSHNEFYMFKQLANYAIPRLAGWHDKFANEGH